MTKAETKLISRTCKNYCRNSVENEKLIKTKRRTQENSNNLNVKNQNHKQGHCCYQLSKKDIFVN